MANVEINDLGTVTSLALSDQLEIQHTSGGLSKKITSQQILDLVEANLQNAQLRFVAQDGNDTTGNGSLYAPWATLQKAYTEITDASAIKPYKIKVINGVYNFISVLPKPNIFVDFDGSQVTIANDVDLDISWIGSGGVLVWENSFNSNFNFVPNFTGVTVFSILKFSNHRENVGNISIEGLGSVVSSNIDSISGMGLSINDSNSNIQNCRFANVFLSNQNINIEYQIFSCLADNLQIFSNSNDPLTVAMHAFRVKGNTDIANFVTSNMFIRMTDCVATNALSINNTGSGTIDVFYDYIPSNASITGIVTLHPLIPSSVWGKHEISSVINGNPNTVVSETTPTQLNTSTPDFQSVYDQKGISVISGTFGGLLQNNTGRDGWFRITSNLSFMGTVLVGQFEFVHMTGSSNPPTTQYSPTKILADSSLTLLTEVSIESDIYLNNGDYVQLMAQSKSGASRNLTVISLTTRVTGT